MTASAVGLVLLAAVLHVAWNSFVRSSGDRLVAMWSVVIGGALIAMLVLVVVGPPRGASLGWLTLSTLLHVGYGFSLVAAYERSELSVAYPIARSMAPPLVTIGGVGLLGDSLSAVEVIGIAGISIAIATLIGRRPRNSIVWPLITGLFIAGYSLSDGAGVRANGNSVQFISLLFVTHATGFTAILSLNGSHRSRMREALARRKTSMLIGGATGYAAYLLVLIAARTNPLGAVSALRETSTILAVFVGAFILKESVPRRAFLAAGLAALGSVLIAL